MKVRAKFKGKDGSLGYKNGSDYSLDFNNITHPFGSTKEVIHIEKANDLERITTVIYSSLRKFLDNWEVL